MDDDDRPRPRDSKGNYGAASLLSGESLESYSLEDLDARVELLEAEIARVTVHRKASAAHQLAAQALFKPRTS